MTGLHAEFGADIDCGSVLPGVAANTHHFSNASGYVGTISYRTPSGSGDAGISVEFGDLNSVKITAYTGGAGPDRTTNTVLDTGPLNAARTAVDNWIGQQPGGASVLDAAARVGKFAQGDYPAQTVDVAGVTARWGGSVRP
jgi:hypothetical protein